MPVDFCDSCFDNIKKDGNQWDHACKSKSDRKHLKSLALADPVFYCAAHNYAIIKFKINGTNTLSLSTVAPLREIIGLKINFNSYYSFMKRLITRLPIILIIT